MLLSLFVGNVFIWHLSFDSVTESVVRTLRWGFLQYFLYILLGHVILFFPLLSVQGRSSTLTEYVMGFYHSFYTILYIFFILNPNDVFGIWDASVRHFFFSPFFRDFSLSFSCLFVEIAFMRAQPQPIQQQKKKQKKEEVGRRANIMSRFSIVAKVALTLSISVHTYLHLLLFWHIFSYFSIFRISTHTFVLRFVMYAK